MAEVATAKIQGPPPELEREPLVLNNRSLGWISDKIAGNVVGSRKSIPLGQHGGRREYPHGASAVHDRHCRFPPGPNPRICHDRLF